MVDSGTHVTVSSNPSASPLAKMSTVLNPVVDSDPVSYSPAFASSTDTPVKTEVFDGSKNIDVFSSTSTDLAEGRVDSALDFCLLVLTNLPADSPVSSVAKHAKATLEKKAASSSKSLHTRRDLFTMFGKVTLELSPSGGVVKTAYSFSSKLPSVTASTGARHVQHASLSGTHSFDADDEEEPLIISKVTKTSDSKRSASRDG